MDAAEICAAPAAPFSSGRKAQRKLQRYEAIRAKRRQLRPLERQRRRQRQRVEGCRPQKPDEHVLQAACSGSGHSVRIAVDLSYTDSMSAKERARLANQLKRCWAVQKKAHKPAQVYLTALDTGGDFYSECCERHDGFERYKWNVSAERLEQLFAPHELVYLCPDADAPPLESIQLDKVYVIGGLVDECRQSGATAARAHRVSAAKCRLPIAEHMQRAADRRGTGATTLTVNQVFEALVLFACTANWTDSLLAVLPARFGFEPKLQPPPDPSAESVD